MHVSSSYCAVVLTKVEKVTQTLYRILAKTNNPRLSFNDFDIEILGSSHLDTRDRCTSIIARPQRTHSAPIYDKVDNPLLRCQ